MEKEAVRSPLAGQPVKAVSFDLWLTLIKSNPDARRGRVEAIARAFSVEATDALDALANEVSREFDEASAETGVDYNCEDRLDRIADRIGKPRLDPAARRGAADAIQAALLQHPPKLIEEDLPETLGVLAAKGVKLATVSNTGYAEGATMRQNLEKLGLAQHLTASLFSDEMGCAKPSPEVFQKLCDCLGCEPHEILHVGDSQKADVGGATASGMHALHFDPSAAESGGALNAIKSLTH